MSTLYDWVTVFIFMGLLALYFLRQDRQDVSISRYIIASTGCAAANYLGNEGLHMIAAVLIGATLYFIWYFILSPPETGKDES